MKRPNRKKKILIVVVILLFVLFAGLLAAIPFAIMPSFLGQRYEQTQYDSLDYGIAAERLTLTTDDNLRLAAWRTRADNAKGSVILLSGIQNPSVTAFFGYAKMLADNGWDSLLIEMRARSESEGEEIGFGMTEWRDVKAGVDFLSQDADVGDLPLVAMGTSMGAGTVLIAAGELPEVDAVISLSAFSAWSDLFVDYMTASGMPPAIGAMDVPFVNLYLGLHFGFDALEYSPVNGMQKLKGRPVLMMHSTGDTQVPFTQFEKLMAVAEKGEVDVRSFIREGDEHFICYERFVDDPTQDVEFSQSILNFLDSYFP